MDPYLSFAISLLFTLALWWGSMRATLAGDLDFANSGFRFLLAFLLARSAVSFFNYLLNNYRDVTHQRTHSQTGSAQALQDELHSEQLSSDEFNEDFRLQDRRRGDPGDLPSEPDPTANLETSMTPDLTDRVDRGDFEVNNQTRSIEMLPDP